METQRVDSNAHTERALSVSYIRPANGEGGTRRPVLLTCAYLLRLPRGSPMSAIGAAIVLVVITAATSCSTESARPRMLWPSTALTATIGGTEAHIYSLELDRDQYVTVAVD